MKDDVHAQTARLGDYQQVKYALQAMNEAGQFEAAVLTSVEGLPIITIPTNYDSHVAAALVAMLRKISDRAENQLGMAEVDEITIYGRDRIRLVCRYIPSTDGENSLMLAVMVPPGQSYRRVTNRAVRQIRHLLP
jgi:predicted regulator of Ras-like GTPase activity (Roadblock/LC7/MglB family)